MGERFLTLVVKSGSARGHLNGREQTGKKVEESSGSSPQVPLRPQDKHYLKSQHAIQHHPLQKQKGISAKCLGL